MQRSVLEVVADGIWMAQEPVRIAGMRLSTNMTVLRVAEGQLLVHSPIALTPERRAAVDALGTVAHVYAPSLYHHLWAGDWARAYPTARLHAPAALAAKRPDLRIDRAHDRAGPEPAFAGVIDEHRIEGCRLEETVLRFHPARTLVVADLVHNVGRPDDLWTVFYTRMAGFYDRVALSRVLRWLAFSDRRAARRSLEAVLEHPFERMLVGHGTPVEKAPRAALTAAYAWLPPASPAMLPGSRPTPARWLAGDACG